jgi:hypothetical protein
VAIIRKHLLDGVAVPDLCDAHELHPIVYYRWQKEFFEGGAAAFAKEPDRYCQVNRVGPDAGVGTSSSAFHWAHVTSCH